MNSLVEDIFSLYEKEESKPRSRMPSASNGLASLCERYAWYDMNSPKPRKINPYTGRRFMYGKVHEEIIVDEISRLEEKGWRLKGSQLKVSMWGIKGVIDLLIRSPQEQGAKWYLLEIKTMNPEGFKEFKSEGLDSVPRYREQAMFYLGALQEIPFREKDKISGGILLVENTFPLGELHSVDFELDQDLLQRMSTKIEEIRELVVLSQPPPRPFTRESKDCTYCFRKKECWGSMPSHNRKTHYELTDPQEFARLLTAHLKSVENKKKVEETHEESQKDMRNFLEKENVTDIWADFGNGVTFSVSLSETEVKEYNVKAHSYIRLDIR